MYTVAVSRDFAARHYLIGGDWGAENQPHEHRYRVEVRLMGAKLDEHGYLVDIVDIESRLGALVSRYRDRQLNDLDEFAGMNPSIEHFSRLICLAVAEGLPSNVRAVAVRLWENEIAWAEFQLERQAET